MYYIHFHLLLSVHRKADQKSFQDRAGPNKVQSTRNKQAIDDRERLRNRVKPRTLWSAIGHLQL
jgi:hypothetical protein